ncbi:hypothetical protein BJX70DRAFT_311012 [Aspergillus crustosus]
MLLKKTSFSLSILFLDLLSSIHFAGATSDSGPHTKHLAQATHPHAPAPEDTKHADWVIILVLAVVVFTVFAIGLMSQYRDTLVLFCRSKYEQLDEEKEHESEYEFRQIDNRTNNANHNPSRTHARRRTMSTVNSLAARSRSHSLMESAENGFAGGDSRWVTQNGDLNQHLVDVNGSKKLVLFVDSKAVDEEDGQGAGGEYTEWLKRWRRERAAG